MFKDTRRLTLGKYSLSVCCIFRPIVSDMSFTNGILSLIETSSLGKGWCYKDPDITVKHKSIFFAQEILKNRFFVFYMKYYNVYISKWTDLNQKTKLQSGLSIKR